MSTRRTRRRTERGFTIVEMAITIVVVALVLGAATRLLGATTELTRESNVHTLANAELRRNMAYVASVLRSVASSTLQGFDADGVATTLEFQRTVGVDLHSYLHTGVQRVEWRPSYVPVDGVARPGAVWLVDGSHAEILAARVPYGGFQVRREGSVLAVRLTTYYASSPNHVARATGETAVSLRN